MVWDRHAACVSRQTLRVPEYHDRAWTLLRPSASARSIDAVLSVQNQSNYTITFDFRWTPSSSWTTYTEVPGQGEIFSTGTRPLSPQALLPHDNVRRLADDCQPCARIQPVVRDRHTARISRQTLRVPEYRHRRPDSITRRPRRHQPEPQPGPNWSGYVAATNLLAADEFGDSRQRLVGRSDGDRSIERHDSTLASGWASTAGALMAILMSSKSAPQRTWLTAAPNISRGGRCTRSRRASRSRPSPADGHAGRFDHGLGPIYHLAALTPVSSTCRSSTIAGRTILSARTKALLNCRLPSPMEHAEWIVEATTVGGSIATLPNFGSVTFTNAKAVINGVSGPINAASWQSQAVNIGSNGVTYDTTSVLTNSGTSFVVTYNRLLEPPCERARTPRPVTASGVAVGTTLRSSKTIAGPVIRGLHGPEPQSFRAFVRRSVSPSVLRKVRDRPALELRRRPARRGGKLIGVRVVFAENKTDTDYSFQGRFGRWAG